MRFAALRQFADAARRASRDTGCRPPLQTRVTPASCLCLPADCFLGVQCSARRDCPWCLPARSSACHAANDAEPQASRRRGAGRLRAAGAAAPAARRQQQSYTLTAFAASAAPRGAVLAVCVHPTAGRAACGWCDVTAVAGSVAGGGESGTHTQRQPAPPRRVGGAELCCRHKRQQEPELRGGAC